MFMNRMVSELSCWYQHDEEMETDESTENENIKKQKHSVFQKVSPNLKPPIKIQEKQKVD